MSEPTYKLASYKRIILCADGTWLSSDKGDSSVPSNVAKIARAIANSGLDDNGNLVKQIVYYHSGLGSGDMPFQKAIEGGIGIGLETDVCQIYDFISNNYEPGDELFFFGFSRGAFTVRSVAGLVCEAGILSAVGMTNFGDMWQAYRENTDRKSFRDTTWYKDNAEQMGLGDVQVKVIGVWDTVGALGIPDWPMVGELQRLGLPINKQYAFHNTKVSKKLLQCWLPGVHGNIGGQAEDPRTAGDYEEIGDITFAWMVDNLSGMITFEEPAIDQLIEQHRLANNKCKVSDGWGCGPIVDNFSGLQGKFFSFLGRTDRTPSGYANDPGDHTGGATNECFHPITRIRKTKCLDYKPPPLDGFTPVEPSTSSPRPDGEVGWSWKKAGFQDIPEYVIGVGNRMSVAYEEHGKIVAYKTIDSLTRGLCPKDVMADLDRDNNIV